MATLMQHVISVSSLLLLMGLVWLGHGGVGLLPVEETAAESVVPEVVVEEAPQPVLRNSFVVGSIPYWDQEQAVASFEQHADAIDSLSLFWYRLNAAGRVTTYEATVVDTGLVERAQAQGVQVLALVANLPDYGEEVDDWDPARVDKAIGTVTARRQHIADLLALVDEHGYDGIHIDYEGLRPDQRTSFSRFIRDLSGELEVREKVLAVSLLPKDSEGSLAFAEAAQAQDWEMLSRWADQLHVMAYEEHWDGSGPGSVASEEWVAGVLAYAQQLIPADRLVMGIPLYGYDWGPAPLARGLTFAEVAQRREQGSSVRRQGETGSASFTYQGPDGEHEVWYEDAVSVAGKLQLMQAAGVDQFVLWRLGGEDPGIWEQ